MIKEKTIKRFWSKVDKSGDCWEWTGVTTPEGYGRFVVWYRTENQLIGAHRVSIYLDGRDPRGKVVRHTCDNPSCVNPNHLILGTIQDNIQDRSDRNRQAVGEKVHTSKLTKEQVLEIRASNKSITELTEQFNVSPWAIRNILNRKSWKHI